MRFSLVPGEGLVGGTCCASLEGLAAAAGSAVLAELLAHYEAVESRTSCDGQLLVRRDAWRPERVGAPLLAEKPNKLSLAPTKLTLRMAGGDQDL